MLVRSYDDPASRPEGIVALMAWTGLSVIGMSDPPLHGSAHARGFGAAYCPAEGGAGYRWPGFTRRRSL